MDRPTSTIFYEDKHFNEIETQTSVKSFSVSDDSNSSQSTIRGDVPIPEPLEPARVWGPIKTPIVNLRQVGCNHCKIQWDYQEDVVYYMVSCIQLFGNEPTQQIIRKDSMEISVSLLFLVQISYIISCI